VREKKRKKKIERERRKREGGRGGVKEKKGNRGITYGCVERG